MAKRKFSAKELDGANIDAVFGDRIENVPAGTTVERRQLDDVEVDLEKLKNLTARFTMGDEISYSESDFQAALTTVGNVLSKGLEAKHLEEMQRIVTQIQHEKAKPHPDLTKLRELLGHLSRLISLAKLAAPVAHELQTIVSALVAKYLMHG